uniref:Uncharacterized protein n=1 Tax=Anguilla anguilla TaxID=7936 RepID=A0A0E9XS45_ANGAN
MNIFEVADTPSCGCSFQ